MIARVLLLILLALPGPLQYALAAQGQPESEQTRLFAAAVSNGNLEMMRVYLSQGADINCRCINYTRDTPLIAAVSRAAFTGNTQVFDYLIRHGADINKSNAEGVTPLMAAARMEGNAVYTESASYLMENLVQDGANLNAIDSNGDSALHYLMASYGGGGLGNEEWRQEFLEVIKYLVSHGANINAQNKKGRTPLMMASRACLPDEVSLLLTLGADPAIKTRLGDTALSIAGEAAAQSPQGSPCNQTFEILSHPQNAQSPLGFFAVAPRQSPGMPPNPVTGILNAVGGIVHAITGQGPQQ